MGGVHAKLVPMRDASHERMGIARAEAYGVALFVESLGDRKADAAIGAGDEDDAAVRVEHRLTRAG